MVGVAGLLGSRKGGGGAGKLAEKRHLFDENDRGPRRGARKYRVKKHP